MKLNLAVLLREGGSPACSEQSGRSENCSRRGGLRICAFAAPGNALAKKMARKHEARMYRRFTLSFLHRPIRRHSKRAWPESPAEWLLSQVHGKTKRPRQSLMKR